MSREGNSRKGGGQRSGPGLEQQAELAAWPSPEASASNRSLEAWYRGKPHLVHSSTPPLTVVAQLASWATPTSRDHKDGSYTANVPENALLGRQVWQAGWPTPDAQKTSSAKGLGDRPSRAATNRTTGYLAEIVVDPASGPTPSGSPAATAKPGQLNPAFSRWLQGYPAAWCQAAIRASLYANATTEARVMRLRGTAIAWFRRSLPSSSRRTST